MSLSSRYVFNKGEHAGIRTRFNPNSELKRGRIQRNKRNKIAKESRKRNRS